MVTGFAGTIHVESTDKVTSLPSNFAFTPADGGAHSFGNGVTLKTAGMQTIAVIDTTNASIMGSAKVLVSSAPGGCISCFADSSIMGTANVLVSAASHATSHSDAAAPIRGAFPLVKQWSAPPAERRRIGLVAPQRAELK